MVIGMEVFREAFKGYEGGLIDADGYLERLVFTCKVNNCIDYLTNS